MAAVVVQAMQLARAACSVLTQQLVGVLRTPVDPCTALRAPPLWLQQQQQQQRQSADVGLQGYGNVICRAVGF